MAQLIPGTRSGRSLSCFFSPSCRARGSAFALMAESMRAFNAVRITLAFPHRVGHQTIDGKGLRTGGNRKSRSGREGRSPDGARRGAWYAFGCGKPLHEDDERWLDREPYKGRVSSGARLDSQNTETVQRTRSDSPCEETVCSESTERDCSQDTELQDGFKLLAAPQEPTPPLGASSQEERTEMLGL
ncbi:hypothetical protein BD413DRAFT_307198 [Trametes elegans]|nr:hypothetical protein BD413DRAFT_307198 [Trametes elegans]